MNFFGDGHSSDIDLGFGLVNIGISGQYHTMCTT
jgi:hypothetical protein